MNQELTICSVAYQSKSCMDLNWELTRALNSGAPFTWIVVENTNSKSAERMPLDDERFQMIDGIYENDPPDGSYHHGFGLNKALEQVNTRFALFLDPDFFIVENDWIKRVLEYMKERGLSFFGAPYHPSRYTKYRYFPCATCLFVDLSRVAKEDLDFAPAHTVAPAIAGKFQQRLRGEADSSTPLYHTDSNDSADAGRRPSSLRQSGYHILRRREIIGSVKDVGYRIYHDYAHRKDVLSECVVSVYREPGNDKDIVQRVAEFLLPDSWCYVPKARDYYDNTGFRERQAYDVDRLGWEEYLWKGEPFGFHVRGLFQSMKQIESNQLEDVVHWFLHHRTTKL
jgi:hypothetical protein